MDHALELRQITPSEISIILQMILSTFNNLLLIIKIRYQLKKDIVTMSVE